MKTATNFFFFENRNDQEKLLKNLIFYINLGKFKGLNNHIKGQQKFLKILSLFLSQEKYFKIFLISFIRSSKFL